jgi:hypothetical protein
MNAFTPRAKGKILVDGGDPEETVRVKHLVGSLPGADFVYQGTDKADRPLKPIAYKSIDLNRAWEGFDIQHDLTTKGIQQFVADYKSTLKQSG